MARLLSGIQFIGTLGDVTAYRLPGSDKIYLRKKGGNSKEKMLADPSFELPLHNAGEFKIASKAAGLLRQAILPVSHLRAPGLNINAKGLKIAKKLQKLDEEHDLGQRAVFFSRFKTVLKGFDLHPRRSLDRIIRSGIKSSINRLTGSAQIVLPPLQEGLTLHLPWSDSLYRFVVHLGVLPDKYFADNATGKQADKLPYVEPVYTPWQFRNDRYAGDSITLQLTNLDYLREDMTLLLSIGMEMGTQITEEYIETRLGVGSAMIICVG